MILSHQYSTTSQTTSRSETPRSEIPRTDLRSSPRSRLSFDRNPLKGPFRIHLGSSPSPEKLGPALIGSTRPVCPPFSSPSSSTTIKVVLRFDLVVALVYDLSSGHRWIKSSFGRFPLKRPAARGHHQLPKTLLYPAWDCIKTPTDGVFGE